MKLLFDNCECGCGNQGAYTVVNNRSKIVALLLKVNEPTTLSVFQRDVLHKIEARTGCHSKDAVLVFFHGSADVGHLLPTMLDARRFVIHELCNKEYSELQIAKRQS